MHSSFTASVLSVKLTTMEHTNAGFGYAETDLALQIQILDARAVDIPGGCFGDCTKTPLPQVGEGQG